MSGQVKMVQYEQDTDEVSQTGLVQRLYHSVKDTVLTPLRFLTSKFALRAYITTILFAIAAFILFALAITAYTLFYWSYIPRIGFERPIHLQFDRTAFSHPVKPYGTVALNPDVVSQQQYDISVVLNMPRTPSNTRIGNFMLDCKLYAPATEKPTIPALLGDVLPLDLSQSQQLLAHARRSAILTYLSHEVEFVTRAVQLHWYILGWRREEETLSVNVFDKVEFSRGRKNVPTTFRLELQVPASSSDSNDAASFSGLQIYDAKVVFRARFRGLRYLMYNHRIASAVVFITCFWLTELTAAALAWTVLSVLIFSGARSSSDTDDHLASPAKPQQPRRISAQQQQQLLQGGYIKDEFRDSGSSPLDARLSDTERNFPTYDRSLHPMRYTSPPQSAGTGVMIKTEDDEGDDDVNDGRPLGANAGGGVMDEDDDLDAIAPASATSPFGGPAGSAGLVMASTANEADDEEDEDADFVLDEATGKWRDSGLGTSMESSGGGPSRLGLLRRRRSRN